MSYVIVRNEDGAFVSNPATNGTGASYTVYLQKAKRFPSLEAAKKECCLGNESIKHVEDCFK